MLLNEDQERRLSVTFRIVEDSLWTINQLLTNNGSSGTLEEITNDVSSTARDEIIEKSTRANHTIKLLADLLGLKKERLR